MTEILSKIVNDWWDTAGMEFRTFLSDLSGNNCFHDDLPVSDRLNVYLYAKINEILFDKEAKDYLLKDVCSELADRLLASRHGVSIDDLFDHDGNFHEQYQDEFNRLYDILEEKMTDFEKGNPLPKISTTMKTSCIYTTGAFVHPVEIQDKDSNRQWRWVVSQFEDDTYLDGKTCNPVVSAETCEKLLLPDDDDE